MMNKILVTGNAGFIGFHLCGKLLSEGSEVLGIDAMPDYYEEELKQDRHWLLSGTSNRFSEQTVSIKDFAAPDAYVSAVQPDVVAPLAAQAGGRYNLEGPQTFIGTNIAGTFNAMERARASDVRHLPIASTSSVYDADQELPSDEHQKAAVPLTIYAATKKAAEANVLATWSDELLLKRPTGYRPTTDGADGRGRLLSGSVNIMRSDSLG